MLILTRASAIPYLSRVLVAPITSTIRGGPSEVALGTEDGMRQPSAANLHNVLTGASRSWAAGSRRPVHAACRRCAPRWLSPSGATTGRPDPAQSNNFPNEAPLARRVGGLDWKERL